MAQIISVLRYLKIDIILGSISSLLFFSHLFEANVPWFWHYLLGTGIWFVYMLDHIIDAYHIGSDKIKPEHLFVWNNRKIIVTFMIFLFISMSAISFIAIEIEQLFYSIILLSIIVFYFATHHYLRAIKRFPKEFIIGSVYSFSTMLPALIHSNNYDTLQIPIVAVFMLLALTNVFVFSFFDYRYDQKNKQHNFIKIIGRKKGQKWIIQTLSLIVFLCIINILFGVYIDFAIIQLLMALTLCFIIKWPVYFLKNHNYPIIADGIFLIPAIIIFYR